MENKSMFMDREETIRRIDNFIRALSHLDSTHEGNSVELNLKNAVDKEDIPKLEDLLEDLVVLLRDDLAIITIILQ